MSVKTREDHYLVLRVFLDLYDPYPDAFFDLITSHTDQLETFLEDLKDI